MTHAYEKKFNRCFLLLDDIFVTASAQATSPHTNDVSFFDRSSVIEDQNTEFNDEQETIYTSAVGASQIQFTPTSQPKSVIVTPNSVEQSTQELKSNNNYEAVPKAEPDSLEYHLGDDSDVEFVPIVEEIYEISDHLTTQEQFLAMPGDSQESQHSNQRDSLITVHTQPDGRVSDPFLSNVFGHFFFFWKIDLNPQFYFYFL